MIKKRDVWYTQYSGPSKHTSNVWFVPRKPHPERLAKYAVFARLRSCGANKSNSNDGNNHHNKILVP